MTNTPVSDPRSPPYRPAGDVPNQSTPNPNVVPTPKPGGRGQRPPQKPGKGMPLPGRA